jgi:hypothetical protein
MAHLSICLFGSFEATLDGEPVSGFASQGPGAAQANPATIRQD